MADIKKVHILMNDKTKQIPYRLNDPFIREPIECNPDAWVSDEFGKELCKTYSCFEIITSSEPVSKDGYTIYKHYKMKELGDRFDRMTPDQKDFAIDCLDIILGDVPDREIKFETKKETKKPKEEVKTKSKEEQPKDAVVNI